MKRLLLFTSLVLGLPACGGMFCADSCGCIPAPKVGNYDITGTTVSAISNAGSSALVLGAAESVSRSQFALRFSLTTRLVAVQEHQAGWGAAYACSPAEPKFTELVTAITVTSNSALDAQHPAGSSLNYLLSVYDVMGNPLADGLLSDYVQRRAQQPALMLELRLANPAVASTGPQQFTVVYQLSNGEIYTAQTSSLTLTQ
ncbi:hypothetical protein ACFPAF_08360 [Hymenobacter endophyticus]|uniref:DUF5034 domain-containing protein n=1 Tax=Hymenobacter endophyticus TaxID=3076335 RepID=A0ABU3TGA5_9BACT|nr:hypothetical protein [Hymenobacter endophyticus]MDU0370398.1 hypothetical protein [Hymenobacter endophyticus]